MSDATLFQYCQKLVLFRNEGSEVLLARRAGEADYDKTYTFIGGKLETTDGGIVQGLKREKDEEIGPDVQLLVCDHTSYNVQFQKSSGQYMMVPHHYAEYVSGEIRLNPDEYDDYTWVPVAQLASFGPKVANIPEIVAWAQRLRATLTPKDFTQI